MAWLTRGTPYQPAAYSNAFQIGVIADLLLVEGLPSADVINSYELLCLNQSVPYGFGTEHGQPGLCAKKCRNWFPWWMGFGR